MNPVAINLKIVAFRLSLKLMSLAFLVSPRLRKEIDNKETGFVFNAKYQFRTRDDKVKVYVIFADGRMTSGSGTVDDPDVTIFYRDRETCAKIFGASPEESLDYLLTNEMSTRGNMAYLTRFSYLGTLLRPAKKTDYHGPENRVAFPKDVDSGGKRKKLENERLGRKVDDVRTLEDPYLAQYDLDDFPRLKALRKRRFSLRPAVCVERAKLLTEFHRANGFETDAAGAPIDPVLRQARAVKHILEGKRPIIHDGHLLAGSTTSKEVGVPIYPEFIGTLIWPELKTIGSRDLNPNDLSPEDADVLNFEVFPYWMDRNVREYCRGKYGNPVSQQLEERFVLYFMMKNNAISHTIPNFEMVLDRGLEAIALEAQGKERGAGDAGRKNFYKALQLAVDGVLVYAAHLAAEAGRMAEAFDATDRSQPARAHELREIARICTKVPARPAESLHEAVMSIWLSFVCLHAENANSALSIGRLDRLLNPYFLADMEKAGDAETREAVIRRSIELVGSLFLKLNDHDPLVPNVGNRLFGGSSSDDTVTVGGVDRDGGNAVCDMTYIILKAAEILCFQDPNMNARYYSGVNSTEYLRRLCEANVNMVASPIIHNDRTMIEALVHQGIPIEDARDWAATGCVEPTIAGRHYGHTNCMLLNLVAPMEMALNDGVHPVIGEQIGPRTGDVRDAGPFPAFGDFLEAYKTQLRFLAEKSIEINNCLGHAHQYIHPTPLLSSMFEGPIEKGRDLIFGGARYNSSGVALVSITDVIDSLMVVRDLVYDRKVLDFPTLMKAIENDFEGEAAAQVLKKIETVPRFGSDEDGAGALAQELIDFCYDLYQPSENYRGGRYLPGYWSISYHVGFGILSGALPSGRKKGKAFTPGLTPAPGASDQLLPNIRTIAALDHLKMPNNIAFNVKLAPNAGDGHARTLDYFTSYVQSYLDEGGMQWQFNVITSETLRDAMKHPDDYRWLIVRISGYNAYFTKLNRDMQIELIERTEYRA